MKRDIGGLAENVFDVLVVGAGVVGAFAAWDASLRGLRVALVDRDDFGSGTSANSLKIVHGGLRYLQGLDVIRARRSIRERSWWLRAAPHLVEPLPFLLPLDGRGLNRRDVLWAGLRLYHLLSWDRNRDLNPSRRLPSGRVVGPGECRARIPVPIPGDTVGGALFHDGLLYDSERAVLEIVLAAGREGATVVNHAEFVGLRPGHEAGGIATIRDAVGGGADLEVATRAVLDASGPWTATADGTAGQEDPTPEPDALRHCVAVNLVTSRPPAEVAYGVATARGTAEPDAASRRLFVVPWRGQAMIGTGYFAGHGTTREQRVARFLRSVNRAIPDLDLAAEEVKLLHEGRLPLKSAGSAPPSERLLEEGWVRDHETPGPPHVISAGTVKYTTGRWIAERAVDRLCRRLGRNDVTGTTFRADLPGAPAGTLDELTADALARHGSHLPEALVHHLVRAYGRRYPGVIRYIEDHPEGDARVVPETPVTVGELAHAAHEEMAVSADDLLFRRTEIGARGWAGPSARRTAEGVLSAAGAAAGPRSRDRAGR